LEQKINYNQNKFALDEIISFLKLVTNKNLLTFEREVKKKKQSLSKVWSNTELKSREGRRESS